MAQLQHELLAILKRTGIHDELYQQLSACGVHHCGADQCVEACWFGARQRRLREIPRVHRLIQHSGWPVFEVRLSRAAWARPIGQLRYANIAWAKQFLRRALDALYQPNVIGVGLFKAFIVQQREIAYWRCEMHYLVAGAEEYRVRNTIPVEKGDADFDAIGARIMAADNLGQAISRILRRDLQLWRHPWQPDLNRSSITGTERTEFQHWLLGLSPGARLFRYGCDASFNKLAKQLRKRPARKKRPYPYWLEHHMFGNHPPNCRCRVCWPENRYWERR